MTTSVYLLYMTRIQCKFAERVLVPGNAFDGPLSTKELLTMDGHRCAATFLWSLNNTDGRFDQELEDVCMGLWSMNLNMWKSLWTERLGYCDKYWHFVKLEKI